MQHRADLLYTDTEQRPGMLTVSVQKYDIADVQPVFGKEAE